MKILNLITNKKIENSTHKGNKHTIEKGTLISIAETDTIIFSNNKLRIKTNNNETVHSLPVNSFDFLINDKVYPVFMTENTNEEISYYAMEFPFQRLELLTQIQNGFKNETSTKPVFKVLINNKKQEFSIIPLNEIKPLF
jgi:hypothetical protein